MGITETQFVCIVSRFACALYIASMGLAGVCKKFYWYDVRVFVGAWPCMKCRSAFIFSGAGARLFIYTLLVHHSFWYIKFSYSIVQAQKWMRRSGSFSVRDAQGPYFRSEVWILLCVSSIKHYFKVPLQQIAVSKAPWRPGDRRWLNLSSSLCTETQLENQRNSPSFFCRIVF